MFRLILYLQSLILKFLSNLCRFKICQLWPTSPPLHLSLHRSSMCFYLHLSCPCFVELCVTSHHTGWLPHFRCCELSPRPGKGITFCHLPTWFLMLYQWHIQVLFLSFWLGTSIVSFYIITPSV
jgi:hypothetical protein